MRRDILAILIAAVHLVAGSAFGDRLLVIPTGTTLGTGEFRAECAVRGDARAYWVATGITRLEVEGAWFNGFGPQQNTAWSAQIAVLPETSFTPALGIGIRDIGDTTDKGAALYDGRSLYVAATKGIDLPEGVTLIQDLKLDAGIGTGSLNGVFFGVEAGLARRLRLIAEYDTKDFNFAATYGIAPLVSARVSSIHGDVFYGLLLSSTR